MRGRRALVVSLASAVGLASARGETPWGAKDERDVIKAAHAYHIMFLSEGEAQAAYRRLAPLDGSARFEQFRAMARAQSKDPGSAPSGGDLGTIREGEMVKSFQAALFSLAQDTISAPVRTQFGWHLIYATDVSVRKVADLCAASLQHALRQASGAEKQRLRFSEEELSPAQRADRVAVQLGAGWSAPILDGDGNYRFIRIGAIDAKTQTAFAVIHTEFTHAVLSAGPQACQRSARTELSIDCPSQTTTIRAMHGFEGRAAVGKPVLAHLPSQRPVPFNDSLFGELGVAACRPR